MSRLPRLHVPGAVYHVTARGNHRQDIFYRAADRKVLDEIMARALDHTGARIHAYCWMTNHFHLLVQVGDRPLGALMQRVGTQFARAVQRNIATTGHLFENRYHALLVDVDNYFLELVRYIHLNPVRAGIVARPEHYRWSSHRIYLGKTEQSWVHTDFTLRLFASDLSIARTRYAFFVNERIGEADYVPQAHQSEPRVLGSDRFLESLPIQVRRQERSTTLDSIAAAICSDLGVTVHQVRSASQRRVLCKARALIAHGAIDKQVASLSEVARFFGRSASALSRAMLRYP